MSGAVSWSGRRADDEAELEAAGSFFSLGRAAAILRALLGIIPAMITAVGTAMVGFAARSASRRRA